MGHLGFRIGSAEDTSRYLENENLYAFTILIIVSMAWYLSAITNDLYACWALTFSEGRDFKYVDQQQLENNRGMEGIGVSRT